MLHPQAQAWLDFLKARGVPPTHTLSVAEARRFYRDRRSVTHPAPPDVGLVRGLSADGPHGAIPCACTGRSAARRTRCCRGSCTTTAAAG